MDNDKLGLNINALMREVLIDHGMAYPEACQVVEHFGAAFDSLTGTEWVEINGLLEFHITDHSRTAWRAHTERLSEDKRKKLGLPSSCPCGREHSRVEADGRRDG